MRGSVLQRSFGSRLALRLPAPPRAAPSQATPLIWGLGLVSGALLAAGWLAGCPPLLRLPTAAPHAVAGHAFGPHPTHPPLRPFHAALLSQPAQEVELAHPVLLRAARRAVERYFQHPAIIQRIREVGWAGVCVCSTVGHDPAHPSTWVPTTSAAACRAHACPPLWSLPAGEGGVALARATLPPDVPLQPGGRSHPVSGAFCRPLLHCAGAARLLPACRQPLPGPVGVPHTCGSSPTPLPQPHLPNTTLLRSPAQHVEHFMEQQAARGVPLHHHCWADSAHCEHLRCVRLGAAAGRCGICVLSAGHGRPCRAAGQVRGLCREARSCSVIAQHGPVPPPATAASTRSSTAAWCAALLSTRCMRTRRPRPGSELAGERGCRAAPAHLCTRPAVLMLVWPAACMHMPRVCVRVALCWQGVRESREAERGAGKQEGQGGAGEAWVGGEAPAGTAQTG